MPFKTKSGNVQYSALEINDYALFYILCLYFYCKHFYMLMFRGQIGTSVKIVTNKHTIYS